MEEGEEEKNTWRILVWNTEWKGPLGRRKLRLVDNIKIDIREKGCGGMDWIGLAQVRD
jgi:hypothetical protein